MTTMPTAKDMLAEHRMKREELIKLEKEMHFSYDLEAGLTDEERTADLKLIQMREEIANNEFLNRTIHSFFKNKKIMEESKLFAALNTMPKGAIHHIHTTAANPIDAYLALTYDERVYYSGKDRLFKVFPKHKGVPSGYVACTTMREFTHSRDEFDTILKNQILLGENQAQDMESHEIWKHFQHKFTKVGELGKFIPFF